MRPPDRRGQPDPGLQPTAYMQRTDSVNDNSLGFDWSERWLNLFKSVAEWPIENFRLRYHRTAQLVAPQLLLHARGEGRGALSNPCTVTVKSILETCRDREVTQSSLNPFLFFGDFPVRKSRNLQLD